MLSGSPPFRSEKAVTEFESAANLEDRLEKYRQLLANAPRPNAHRQAAGVDRALADIVDNCLAVDRNRRFANVQAVLDALQARAQRRAWRPLVVLGTLGPALVLLVMSFFASQWFDTVVRESDDALRARALESNRFAAQ